MKISISKFRSYVSHEWLSKQSFPIYLTQGAGNGKRIAFVLLKNPIDPPLKTPSEVKAHIKLKISATSLRVNPLGDGIAANALKTHEK
jgi:hypothetical protein